MKPTILAIVSIMVVTACAEVASTTDPIKQAVSGRTLIAGDTRLSIELDQDTKGVLGSPPIADVILNKIKAADVVVSDVTLVASGRGDKRHINSNVAIELG